MSLARDPSLRDLNDCGCCEGLSARTPLEVVNRPGLSAIAYRSGTHAQFKRSMLAALSNSQRLALQRLNTRDDDDFSIALLDAWATVADVLTFYQERIANESYLRTATERLSVVELARALGYELTPGVAASTYLAFTVEDGPGAPGYATIDPGTKVQSLPGPGEAPQTFETVEKIEARAAWNAIKPRLTAAQTLSASMTALLLQGTDLNLRTGDMLLIVTPSQRAMRRIVSVQLDTTAQQTRVTLEAPGVAATAATGQTGVWALRVKAAPFGHNAPLQATLSGSTVSYTEWDLASTDQSNTKVVYLDALYDQIQTGGWVVIDRSSGLGGGRVIRQVNTLQPSDRSDYGLAGRVTQLTLDSAWFETLPPAPKPKLSLLRGVAVYAQSEPLTPAEAPRTDPVYGNEVILDNVVEGLEAGRTLLFVGKRTRIQVSAALLLEAPGASTMGGTRPGDGARLVVMSASDVVGNPGVKRWRPVDENGVEWQTTAPETALSFMPSQKEDPVIGETAALANATSEDRTHTKLVLTKPLQNVYDRAALTIYANVALATHGETRSEVLGSGNAGQTNQRFTLRQSPLTHVPADTPSGGSSTLEVRVNDVLWTAVPTLFGRGSRDRVYVARRDEEGKTTVQFGDGRAGARLPGGQENIKAVYRQGIGREGQARAAQLSLLMTRPLGVKAVTNPLPATGAEDPQKTEDARRNAPLTVLTLDRIVSLEDYADFARSFSGIAKALATWTWNGHARGVLVTVAGENGDAVPEGGPLHTKLVTAMGKAGDPRVPVQVKSYTRVLFKIAARVQVDYPAYLKEKVLAAVKAALQTTFSFEARSFGQSVALSEVIAVIQNVPGVVAVDVDRLYRGTTPERNPLLTALAPPAGAHAETVPPAELLTLDPTSLEKVEALP